MERLAPLVLNIRSGSSQRRKGRLQEPVHGSRWTRNSTGDGNKDKLFAYRPFVHISLFMDVLTSRLWVDYLPVNIETSNTQVAASETSFGNAAASFMLAYYYFYNQAW